MAERLLPLALSELDRQIETLIGGPAIRPTEPSWLIDAARQARAYALSRGEDPRYSEPDAPPLSGQLAFDAALDRWEEAGGSAEAAHVAGRVFRGDHGLLLSEAITRHLGELQVAGVVPSWVRAKKRELEAFQAFTGDVEVRSITRQLAGTYVSQKVNLSGASANTRRNRVGVLLSFGESLVNSGDLESSPFDRLRKLVRESSRGDESKDKRAYTVEELALVFRELHAKCPKGDPMLAAAAIAAYTGMRIEEVCTLKVAEVTAEGMRITLAKNRNSLRTVPIHPTIATLVERLRASSVDGYLIPGLTRAGADKRRAHALSNRFRRYLHRMGLASGQLDTHSLRRAFATHCERCQVEPLAIQRLMGHTPKGETFGRYSDGPGMARLAAEMSKLSYGAEVDALAKTL